MEQRTLGPTGLTVSAELTAAADCIPIVGARYPEHLDQLTNR